MLSLVVVEQSPKGGVLYAQHDGDSLLVVPTKPDVSALRYALDFLVPSHERATAVFQLVTRQLASMTELDGGGEL